jgi:hypothetical protein
VVLAGVAAGCGSRTAKVSQAEPQPAVEPRVASEDDAYLAPLRRIAKARFIKPPDTGDAEPPFHVALAPIIVQEVGGTDAEQAEADRFGAISGFHDSEIDIAAPTVYWTASTTWISGQDRLQLIYAWAYPSPITKQPTSPRVRAIRMTLAASGMPAIYEVFDSEPGPHRIFVSQSMENLARAEHGPPLPGRRHAIETPVRAGRWTAIVPRILADGPMPMGPLVYLERESRRVMTLLCRCSASQAEEFVETANYQLLPLTALAQEGVKTSDVESPFILPSEHYTADVDDAGELITSFLRLPPAW